VLVVQELLLLVIQVLNKHKVERSFHQAVILTTHFFLQEFFNHHLYLLALKQLVA
jgi:hypothetical protein